MQIVDCFDASDDVGPTLPDSCAETAEASRSEGRIDLKSRMFTAPRFDEEGPNSAPCGTQCYILLRNSNVDPLTHLPPKCNPQYDDRSALANTRQ